jgi:hypothetical protein
VTIPILHSETDVDEVGFHRTLRAQKKREPLAAAPETVEQMAVTYGLSTAAANFGLACYDFPPDLRPLLDAIVGECGDRHGEWFKANDEQIARHAGRSAKWVQRWRPKLAEWMKGKRVALIDIKSHKYQVGETPQPHEYRVNFSRQVAEILLEAEKSPDWQKDIMRALEESALNVKDSDFLPSETTNERRTRKPRNDAQSLITRKLNSAGTLCRRTLEIYVATGKHAQIPPEAVAKLETLLAELKGIVEEQTSEEGG